MLSRLVLTDFRNHPALTLSPGPGFVVLFGENGAGKTNILEAVSLLAPGRGLRRAALSAMPRQGGAGGFGIAATAIAPDGADVELATGTLASAPERRLVRIQGAAAAATSLAEWITVLWLTPAMDRLFVEPAAGRRRFLDRLALALHRGHAHHAQRYEAAMRDRNRLLADPAPDPHWLSALEARMAEHGAAIDAARHDTVTLLGERLAAEPDGPFARARMVLERGGSSDLAGDLARGRGRDAAVGRTLIGPHRADLIVTHAAKDQPAALSSTGEQKALLLGIVLAHADLVAARTDRAPVLLLDEVAAHLDPVRRLALFDRLSGRGQVWMTGTEAGLFSGVPDDATRLAVHPGGVG
ncbi:DNA replication and repair protein RecF [Sphingomonas gellani]|uniref:DNA replication and repair protein RecF n=1 Tax=Sphingomonas gellani TaxID=1166340 RepID=A0A1H8C209_9SPHN|nr:DNA replication/repair protein RecF [Sphingomonas gellani]SEM89155.1 DNA replication and repair protein RecF [Sphingomonas gellani]